jgi:phosphoserine aminotransferase
MFYNTPACFPIYAVGVNVAHMLKMGGIPAMQSLAEERSKILYGFIDSSNGYYRNYVDKKYRSRINVPFRVMDDPTLEAKFIAEAAAAGFIELKGHVSTGGCRASMYNAMPVEGVKLLVEFMRKF